LLGVAEALALLLRRAVRACRWRRLRLGLGSLRLRAARELLDERERLLKLLFASFQFRKLVALGAQHLEQLLDLHLLRERHAPQLLDVALVPEIHERHSKFHLAVVDPLVRFFFIR
jgi:hypothetical protein